MAELMAYAGEKATKAMERALERSKEWKPEPKVAVSVDGLQDVLKTFDEALTSKTPDEVMDGALYVRMLLGTLAAV